MCVFPDALWSLGSCIHFCFSSFQRQQAHYAVINWWQSDGWMRARGDRRTDRRREGNESKMAKKGRHESVTYPKQCAIMPHIKRDLGRGMREELRQGEKKDIRSGRSWESEREGARERAIWEQRVQSNSGDGEEVSTLWLAARVFIWIPCTLRCMEYLVSIIGLLLKNFKLSLQKSAFGKHLFCNNSFLNVIYDRYLITRWLEKSQTYFEWHQNSWKGKLLDLRTTQPGALIRVNIWLNTTNTWLSRGVESAGCVVLTGMAHWFLFFLSVW